MNVEKPITDELEMIPEVKGKIFPISASLFDAEGKPKTVPYSAYESNQGEFIKTLDGYIQPDYVSFRVEIVAETYATAKQLYLLVLNKIKSFAQRTIGNDGLFVSDVEHEEPSESYDKETGLNIVLLDTRIYF